MNSQQEYLNELESKLLVSRQKIEDSLYYLEADVLQKRPAKGKWSVLEILEHLNIIHFYYLEQMEHLVKEFNPITSDTYKISWLGRQAIRSMTPKNGKITNRIKTFKSADPIRLQEKGQRALVPNVVLRDFIQAVERLHQLLLNSKGKDIQVYKVRTYAPFIKLNILEALAFLIAHLERHIQQAENTLQSIGS